MIDDKKKVMFFSMIVVVFFIMQILIFDMFELMYCLIFFKDFKQFFKLFDKIIGILIFFSFIKRFIIISEVQVFVSVGILLVKLFDIYL